MYIPNYTTYSFTDIEGTISHPTYGSLPLAGQGNGSFVISKPQDRAVHDVAADGSVMNSKIHADNGVITINAQQTSSLHRWLQDLFNVILEAPTGEWALITLMFTARYMGKQVTAQYGSFQREPDETFAAQGGQTAWALLFGRVKTERI